MHMVIVPFVCKLAQSIQCIKLKLSKSNQASGEWRGSAARSLESFRYIIHPRSRGRHTSVSVLLFTGFVNAVFFFFYSIK